MGATVRAGAGIDGLSGVVTSGLMNRYLEIPLSRAWPALLGLATLPREAVVTSAMWRTLAAWLVLVLSVGVMSQPATTSAEPARLESGPAASAGVDEPVLAGSMLMWSSGATRKIGFTAEAARGISTDGAMIAHARWILPRVYPRLREIDVHGHDGSTRQLASVPESFTA